MFGFGLARSGIMRLSGLAADARQVAGGDLEHRVDNPGGPQEVRAVGSDVDLMRERILAELSAVRAAHASLEARTEDLQRANSELEQFAYVASHGLQEPLRKVASFCQLLKRRPGCRCPRAGTASTGCWSSATTASGSSPSTPTGSS